MSPDVAASIKARLYNRAKAAEADFQLYLVRYASERFLYRLGESPERGRFVLKGAGLLLLWLADPHRTTRDLDFLASGPSDPASVGSLIRSVCAVPCPEDGVAFDLGSLAISPIRADEEYVGQRVRLTARLGRSQMRLQLDIGFGDATVPPPEETAYPTLLPALPAPRIRVYRRETSLAEKFEAMVKLGQRNGRMKDFHDIWALSSAFAFDGETLCDAVVACFARRATPWLDELPDALTPAFYTDEELRRRWSDYLGKGAFRDRPPTDFAAMGERTRVFFLPLRDHLASGQRFTLMWRPGGPWQ